ERERERERELRDCRGEKGDYVAMCKNGAKEWAEIFLNSNYLAGIRQRGINGGTRSIRFQRCVLE
ncbi:hypothetical protein QQF64_009230, partial [Cirrhinus molitorella]